MAWPWGPWGARRTCIGLKGDMGSMVAAMARRLASSNLDKWYLGQMVYDVLWCLMMFYDVLWCFMMVYDVLWCFMMFYDVLWCFGLLCSWNWKGWFPSPRTQSIKSEVTYPIKHKWRNWTLKAVPISNHPIARKNLGQSMSMAVFDFKTSLPEIFWVSRDG
jgi:hypothetical protein